MIGVLGGMGPLATADFMRKVVECTSAGCDQEHVPMIVHNVPQIPDRSTAIVGGGPSPLAALARGLEKLESAGCSCIVIPCNTAHHWYEDLRRLSNVPILHIADAACGSLIARGLKPGAAVTVLATEGALVSGFYEARLSRHGFNYRPVSVVQDAELVHMGIRLVKSGRTEIARPLFESVLQTARQSGIEAAVLGCTEIALALESSALCVEPLVVDSNRALAEACVHWWQQHVAEPMAAA